MTTKRHFVILIVLILSISGIKTFGQQEPHFTQYMFNQSFFNPAHYGFDQGIAVTGAYRNQWLGFKDPQGHIVSPITLQVTADAPIRILHGGLGVSIMQDKLGFTSNMRVKLGYAYHAQIGVNKLGIGVNADFNNVTNDYSKYITTDNEALPSSGSEASMLTDMAAGIFFQNPHYYISVSSSKILESHKELKGSGGFTQYNVRHYFLTGGYYFTLPEYQGFVFNPSFMLYTDGKALQANIGAIAKYNNKVWGGITYRLQDAACLLVGFAIKDIEVGYSLDVPLSGVGLKAFGSHEITAKYLFKIEREPIRTGYRNTRYL